MYMKALRELWNVVQTIVNVVCTVLRFLRRSITSLPYSQSSLHTGKPDTGRAEGRKDTQYLPKYLPALLLRPTRRHLDLKPFQGSPLGKPQHWFDSVLWVKGNGLSSSPHLSWVALSSHRPVDFSVLIGNFQRYWWCPHNFLSSLGLRFSFHRIHVTRLKVQLLVTQKVINWEIRLVESKAG